MNRWLFLELLDSSRERGVPEDELRDIIRNAGTRSLNADALLKAADGVTSVDEASSMTWI